MKWSVLRGILFLALTPILACAQEQEQEQEAANQDQAAQNAQEQVNLYETEQWAKLKPGDVYQGSIKLNSHWDNHWPLNWITRGDHAKLVKLSDQWLVKQYFSEDHGAQKFQIYDPQKFLIPVEMEVLAGILERHQEMSQIPLRLYIFDKGQRLDHLLPELACEKFFGNENVAIMYYFVGDPLATIGFVKAQESKPRNPEDEPVLDPFLVKALFTKAGSHAASMNLDSKEALYATVAEVSRRMYWIEDELNLVKPVKGLDIEEKNKEQETEEPSMLDKLWQQLGGNRQNLIYFTSGLAVALALLMAAVVMAIYRRTKVYQFPTYRGVPRLGAEYGAGVAEVMQFQDARLSPAEQKKQIEDVEL